MRSDVTDQSLSRVSEQTRGMLYVWSVHKRSHEVAGMTDSCLAGLGF